MEPRTPGNTIRRQEESLPLRPRLPLRIPLLLHCHSSPRHFQTNRLVLQTIPQTSLRRRAACRPKRSMVQLRSTYHECDWVEHSLSRDRLMPLHGSIHAMLPIYNLLILNVSVPGPR